MKKPFMLKTAAKFYLPVLMSIALLQGCSDDPESTNEEEVITTVTVTLTPIAPGVGNVVTLTWDDENLDAIVDENEIDVSGPLKVNINYKAVIGLLNKSTETEIDITEEVKEEAEDHIICFTVTGNPMSITRDDEDRNGLPLGLSSIWTATTSGTRTVKIELRHQPGVKTGDCPGAGETDVNLAFRIDVDVENPA